MTINRRNRTTRGLSVRLALAIFAASFGVALAQAQPHGAFRADIQPLNAEVAGGEVEGSALFLVADGKLEITLAAKGLPAGIMHIQHLHGFMDGQAAACPAPDADTNDDGVVDLRETEPGAGVTLVPFNVAPAELQILTDTYPSADDQGLMTYHATVTLDALSSAVADSYGIEELNLANLVVFLHGVPADNELPDTVASLPDVPAQITVPIACGEVDPL